jgi:hypothetical protein
LSWGVACAAERPARAATLRTMAECMVEAGVGQLSAVEVVWERLFMYGSAVMFRACGLECTHHARVHEKKKVKVLQDGSR